MHFDIACALHTHRFVFSVVLQVLSFSLLYIFTLPDLLLCPIFCSARFSRMVYLVLRYGFAAVYLFERLCVFLMCRSSFILARHCRTNLKLRIASPALDIKINFVWYCDRFCFCRKLCQTEMMIVSTFSIFLR